MSEEIKYIKTDIDAVCSLATLKLSDKFKSVVESALKEKPIDLITLKRIERDSKAVANVCLLENKLSPYLNDAITHTIDYIQDMIDLFIKSGR